MLAAVGAVYWAALKDEEEFTGREKQHLGIRNCKLKGKKSGGIHSGTVELKHCNFGIRASGYEWDSGVETFSLPCSGGAHF